MAKLSKGTIATKEFYDKIGWQPDGDTLGDWERFAWGQGSIQDALDSQRKARLRKMVSPRLNILELACGGNPATFIASGAKSYTAVDFSPAGLTHAAEALARCGVPFKTIEADITALPFDDAAFDLAYSAQAIYHIDTVEGQAAAFVEAMRVVKPGGRAIFVMANPFPLLFPYRMMRRALAMTPIVETLLNKLRAKPPLPYLPMPVSWMRRELSRWGSIEITGYAMATVDMSRKVSETSWLGVRLWRMVAWLETERPDWVARLGNYVIIVVDKYADSL
jgi:ubiquinone/menaquinone biosynthesis C-methylase UbiE